MQRVQPPADVEDADGEAVEVAHDALARRNLVLGADEELALAPRHVR
jgi:hypothetical protein